MSKYTAFVVVKKPNETFAEAVARAKHGWCNLYAAQPTHVFVKTKPEGADGLDLALAVDEWQRQPGEVGVGVFL